MGKHVNTSNRRHRRLSAFGSASIVSVLAMISAGVGSTVGTTRTEAPRPALQPAPTVARLIATQQPKTLLMEVTAYCPCKKCCGPKAQGITASGKRVSHNAGLFVAADTRVLPFHTKLQIPGYARGRAVPVLDRGGAIKGHKLDVFFPTHREALEWGRRKVQVTVFD